MPAIPRVARQEVGADRGQGVGTVALSQRAAVGRRGASFIVIAALGLAALAAFAANSYISGEAQRVAAPIRAAWVAARDIQAGALLTKDDVAQASFPIPGEMTEAYMLVGNATTPPTGVVLQSLRKGQPLLNGVLLPPEAANSVSPLVPLTVTVDGSQRPSIGAFNLPLGRLVAPPPAMREGDRVDLWAAAAPTTPTSSIGPLRAIISDVQILAFTGESDGIVLALSADQLDRLVSAMGSQSTMVLTVRSSRR